MESINSIDIFPWDENFNTGITKIDEQHKKLVQLLNLLASHVAFQSDIPALTVIFDELTDYTAYHFKTEEAIWDQYIVDVDLHVGHKEVHNQFIEAIENFRSQGHSRPVDIVVAEVLAFLARWLASHILENDRYMAMIVLARQSGMSMEMAKQHAHQQMCGSTRVLIDIILSIYETLSTNTLHLMRELVERKRLEQHLAEQLAFNQAVINAEVDGVAVFHCIQASPYLCFTVWNRSMEAISGYTLAEVNCLGLQRILDGKDQQAKLCLERICQGEQIGGEEFVIIHKAGEKRTVQLHTAFCTSDVNGKHVLLVMHDITEHKHIETALHKSNQEMYSLLNSMAEGAYGVDTNGYCRFVNRSFLQILGYDHVDEVIGKHIHELIHHSYADGRHYPTEECKMYEAYLGNKEVHVTDEVYWRKDGSAVPVEYWSQPIITNGVVTGAVATFIDITERRKMEEVNRTAAQYARSLIEASLDPLVTISLAGKITDVNTATEQVTGVGRLALIGSDFADYFTEPDKARSGYQQVFLHGFVTDYPLAIRHISGKITDVLYNASIYRDSNGNVLGVFAAARDITERKQIEAKLSNSESRLRTIIENEPECIKIIDAQGILIQMNPAGLKMIEADNQEQLVGKPMLNVITPEHRKAYAELHARVLAGESVQMEYEVQGLKGGRRWLDTHAVPMKEANGNIVHLAVTRDISERKQAEIDMRIAAIAFESQEGMMVTDADNRILRVNRVFSEITGYTAEEVIGKNPRFLQSDRHDAEFFKLLWHCVNTSASWEGEIWNRRKNGEIFPGYLTIKVVKNQQGVITHYVGTLTDITSRKAAAEEIEHLAFYDPLTGLPNRRLLQDRLKPALAASFRNGRTGALLFIDLDNFKAINDTLGHDMGDLLLQHVAKRLTSCVRECDTVARLGGDEFVVMLEDLSEKPFEAATHAKSIGHKILVILNQPFRLASHDYLSTPSIGAAMFNGQEQSVDELLKQADIAMYQAKTSGRNALCFFDPQMQDSITARVLLEDELRNALKFKEFVLYYQIQIDSAGCPVGAEALIRWRHPTRGLLLPSEFIRVAEETCLILPIGQWVLETACAQLKTWQEMPQTKQLVLSVNVSAKQFFQADFVGQVQSCVERYGIAPKMLKLELTESVLLENIDDTIVIMNALVEYGIHFSLDDFGTGYSSLQYLKQLPLNQLKIDQSFIRDLSLQSSDRAIVRTIIAMAESLNLTVIAQGVETEQQREFLLNNGCSDCQGFLFSKPVPIEQFDHYLLQN